MPAISSALQSVFEVLEEKAETPADTTPTNSKRRLN